MATFKHSLTKSTGLAPVSIEVASAASMYVGSSVDITSMNPQVVKSIAAGAGVLRI